MYSFPPRVDVLFRRSGLKNIVSSSFCGEKRLEICAVPVIGLTSGACIVLFYQLYQRLIRRSHFSVYHGLKLYNSTSSCCRCINWYTLSGTFVKHLRFCGQPDGGGGRGSFCGESEKRADVKTGKHVKRKLCVCLWCMYARVSEYVCVNPSSSNMNVWMCAQECAMHI